MKLWVIAPDEASGKNFENKLNAQGLETELYHAKIAPRVIGDKLNESPQVKEDLEAAIKEGIYRGFDKQVIACYTLQLWLSQINPGSARIYTVFEAMRYFYATEDGRPIWLGTTPLVEKIRDFPTLLTFGSDEVQELVQEIVWRVKGVTGVDTKTAWQKLKLTISDPVILKKRVRQLAWELNGLRIKSVVLGCTELPIAFESFMDPAYELRFGVVDPVMKLAQYLLAK